MPPSRTGCLSLLFLMLLYPGTVPAKPDVDPVVRKWLTALVAKVEAVVAAQGGTAKERRRVVGVRLVIDGAGTLLDASVDSGSGSRGIDEKALAVLREAAPFAGVPPQLLTLDGTAELSFPVEVSRGR